MMAWTTLLEVYLNDPLMVYMALQSPIMWVLEFMWGQSWHLGLLHRVDPLLGEGEFTSDKTGQKIGGLSVGNNALFLVDLFKGVIILEYDVQFSDDALQ